jgi:uncharacterized membrane protein
LIRTYKKRKTIKKSTIGWFKFLKSYAIIRIPKGKEKNMKFHYILGAVLWASLGIATILGVWTPSPASFCTAAFVLAIVFEVLAFE